MSWNNQPIGTANWSGTSYLRGAKGDPGTSAGIVLYLDSATSTTIPTTGAILGNPITTAQTTITHAATNTSNVLIAQFPSATGLLSSTLIPSGIWDFNVYMATTDTANQPSFYFSLYQVDADGVSNPVLIADGSNEPILITNLISSQTLYDYALYVPLFTLTDSSKRIQARLYGNYVGGGRAIIMEFRAGAIDHIHTTLSIYNPPTTPSNWSSYPALTDVDMSNHNINNANTINGAANLTLNAGANVNLIAGATATLQGQDVFSTADGGADIGNETFNVISAKNGYRGHLILSAEAGYGNGINGKLDIVASGGTAAGVILGGEINIIASTPAFITTPALPSALKMSAFGVSTNAGLTSPLLALPGYNVVSALNGVQIVSGIYGGTLPSLAGANFLFGVAALGGAGTRVQNGLAADILTPLAPGNLAIQGNSGSGTISISNLTTLTGDSGNPITMNSILDMHTADIRNVGNIYNSNINLNLTTGTGYDLLMNSGNKLFLQGGGSFMALQPNGDVDYSQNGTVRFLTNNKAWNVIGASGAEIQVKTTGQILLNSPSSYLSLFGGNGSYIEVAPSGAMDIRAPNSSITIVGSNNTYVGSVAGSYLNFNAGGYTDFWQSNSLSFYTNSNYWTVNGANSSFIQMTSAGDLYFQAPSRYITMTSGEYFTLNGASNSLIQTNNAGGITLLTPSNVIYMRGAGTNALTIASNAAYFTGSSNQDLLHVRYDAPYTTLTPTSTNGSVIVEATANPSGISGTNALYTVGGYGGTIFGGIEQGVSGMLTLNVLDSGTATTAFDMRPSVIYARKDMNFSSNSISNVQNITGNGSGTLSGFNIVDGGSGTITGISSISNASGIRIEATDNFIQLDAYGDQIIQGTGDMYLTSTANNVYITGANSNYFHLSNDGSFFQSASSTSGIQTTAGTLSVSGYDGLQLFSSSNITITTPTTITITSPTITTTGTINATQFQAATGYATPVSFPFYIYPYATNLTTSNLSLITVGSIFNWEFNVATGSTSVPATTGSYNVDIEAIVPVWRDDGLNTPYPTLYDYTRWAIAVYNNSNIVSSNNIAYAQGVIGNVSDAYGQAQASNTAGGSPYGIAMRFKTTFASLTLDAGQELWFQITFLAVDGSNLPNVGNFNYLATRVA